MCLNHCEGLRISAQRCPRSTFNLSPVIAPCLCNVHISSARFTGHIQTPLSMSYQKLLDPLQESPWRRAHRQANFISSTDKQLLLVESFPGCVVDRFQFSSDFREDRSGPNRRSLLERHCAIGSVERAGGSTNLHPAETADRASASAGRVGGVLFLRPLFGPTRARLTSRYVVRVGQRA